MTVVLAIDQPLLGSIPASRLTSSPQSTARVCLLPQIRRSSGRSGSRERTYEIFAAGRLVRLIDAFSN